MDELDTRILAALRRMLRSQREQWEMHFAGGGREGIDALAARGFRFAHTYCMGSVHGAVCQPSRQTLTKFGSVSLA